MQRWELINYIIEKKGYDRYLEVGTATYNCFSKINCKGKWGCDPADITHDVHGGHIFGMTSDDFFKGNAGKFQIIFIDGLHLYEQVIKDIVNSYNALEQGGYVILHDCLPFDEDAAGRAPVSPMAAWNGDTYKAIIWFKDHFPEILCRVISEDCGLGFIHKQDNYILPDNVSADFLTYMDYDFTWLQMNHFRLGIVPKEWVFKYLETESKPKVSRAVTDYEKSSQDMEPNGEVWTVCELIRKIHKLASGINDPKAKDILNLAREAVSYTKRMDRKLREYKTDYDSEWWREK